MNNIKRVINNEIKGWKGKEVWYLAFCSAIIIALSIYWQDTLMGIISSLTGVICVVLTGKGKLSCYFFGLINVILYSIIAFNAKYYGDFMLNAFYFLPMQFIGLAMWKKHMNNTIGEVFMLKMSRKSTAIMLLLSGILIFLYGLFLQKLGGLLPFVDSCSTVLSIVAMVLSVKRFAEQWIMWIIVDIVSVIMWAVVFAQGQESIATLIMWSVYLLNAVIMYLRWNKTAKLKEFSNV